MAFPVDADHRFFAPWQGVVIRNDDPDGLHRVKARIPGLVAETLWAYPLTAGGGSPQRGGHIVPAVGADVIVQFLGGDEQRPIYQAANWGVRNTTGKETPVTMRDAGDDAHLVQSLQVGSLVFTVDERPRSGQDGQRFTMYDTKAQKVVLEYDMQLQAWMFDADYLFKVKSGGLVVIEGLQVQVNKRLVKRTVRQI